MLYNKWFNYYFKLNYIFTENKDTNFFLFMCTCLNRHDNYKNYIYNIKCQIYIWFNILKIYIFVHIKIKIVLIIFLEYYKIKQYVVYCNLMCCAGNILKCS